MKQHTNTNPVERIGDTGHETEFTITSNKQAFEILSAGIYADPIMAVIRELSCNAYDAMVEAGKESDPFIIHLPNRMEPYFSVTDNGIGLSDHDLRNMYASYFQSTKTNTNKQIGAFGLGSKSPFSYSKAFDVISRFDGMKRIYTVFINESGVPTMSEEANVETDECNGIEVKIAVRSQDYDTFANKAATMLRYFPIVPTIKGRSSFEFPAFPESATVTDTYVVDKEGSGVIAVQGNVPYRVDASQFTKGMSPSINKFVDRHAITLFFDIGKLDVAASREEVRYDETTSKNLADAIQVAFDNYLVQIDNMMNDLTEKGSTWEIYTTLRAKFDSRTSLEGLVGPNFKFTSDIANQWMKDDKLKYGTEYTYHKIIPYGKGDVRAVRKNHDTTWVGGEREYHIRPHAVTQVVIQDVTVRGSMRMNTKLVVGWVPGIKTIMAIVPITDRVLKNAGVTIVKKDRETELQSIIQSLGNPEVKLVSEWTEDVLSEVRTAARTTGHTFRTLALTSGIRSRAHKPRFKECAEPDNGGLYIEVDPLRNMFFNNNKLSLTNRTMYDMITPVLNVINLSQGTNYKHQDIFCLTKKVVKYVSADKNWSSLEEAYKSSIGEQTDIIEYYKRISNSTVLNLNEAVSEDAFAILVSDLNTNSDFRKLVEPVIKAAEEANEVANDPDHPVSSRDFRVELNQFDKMIGIKHDVKYDGFFSKDDFAPYTMLSHINFAYDRHCTNAREYIELVES